MRHLQKTCQEAYIANGLGLTRTNCCQNCICNDEHTYILCSFTLNSCMRNHSKYTICGAHYGNFHEGEWKTCQRCRRDKNLKNIYDDHATNKFNFVKSELVEKRDIFCCSCGLVSYELADCVDCVTNDNEEFYFCRDPACIRMGGFQDKGKNLAFMFQTGVFCPKESEQRNLSMARSSSDNIFFYQQSQRQPLPTLMSSLKKLLSY